MCGIAGWIQYAGGTDVEERILAKMSGCIAHRGPDGEGLVVVHGQWGRAGLVHRRLAILDVDERSNQPFAAEYGGRKVWVVFNGEIYNFRELRTRLEQELPGFGWRTTGDTEVLCAAYLAWGPACVKELLGMFAFVMVEEGNGTTLLARDRMGQKPLYWATQEQEGKAIGIAFGSELKAVVEVPWVDRAVDEGALGEYLAFGYVPTPGTIYRGVRKLGAGEVAVIREGKAVAERYWEERAYAREGTVRGMMEEAVRSQLVADVDVGCFLSGGVDSSVVALCAQRAMGDRKLQTFTAKFEDAPYDESGYAEEVARHLGTEHRTFLVRAEAAKDLVELAQVFGEPFGDSSCLPTYYLARETRKYVKVALSGDGGDEVFGGYDRYVGLSLSQRVGWLGGVVPSSVGEKLAAGHPKSKWTKVGRFLESVHLPVGERYEAYMRVFGAGVLGAPPLRGEGNWEGPDVVAAAMAWDRRRYLEGDLLAKVDRASMLVNLEVRSPFMDHRLIERMASVSGETLLARGKKGMLKETFAADLPASVFRRPKMGFAVPVGEWFRGELREMLRGLVLSSDSWIAGRFGGGEIKRLIEEHERGEREHGGRLFALLMLELWAREGRP